MKKALLFSIFCSLILGANAQVERTIDGTTVNTYLDLVKLEEMLEELQNQIDQLQNIAAVSGGTADLSALWAAVDANTNRTTITQAQADEIAANTLKVSGDDGDQGIQGEQGLQGDQGLQGLQGDQGLQGEQGLQGDQGLQGEQGIQGEQGFRRSGLRRAGFAR